MMGSCYNCIIEEEASFASDAQTIVNSQYLAPFLTEKS